MANNSVWRTLEVRGNLPMDRKTSLTLASRAALRAIPLLPPALVVGAGERNTWLVAAFRAAALSKIAASQSVLTTSLITEAISAARNVDLHNVTTVVNDASRAIRDACNLVSWDVSKRRSHREIFRDTHQASRKAFVELPSPIGAAECDAEILRDASLALSPIELARTPLWSPGNVWAFSLWNDARRALLRDSNSWRVWTDWYDKVLDGEPTDRLTLENQIMRVRDAIWRTNPEQINVHILELADEPPFDLDTPERADQNERIGENSVPPSVPLYKPAAIEPRVLPDGRIGLTKTSAAAELSDESIRAALAAIREGFFELATDADAANIDPRSIAGLKRLSDRIPLAIPTQEQLFRLGHVEDQLTGYARTVTEEWPPFLAATYHALVRQFDDTMRQFPKWREFKRNAAKDRLTHFEVESALFAASQLAEEIVTDDAAPFVDRELAKAIGELSAPLAPKAAPSPFDIIGAGKEELALDVIESLSNFTKKLAEIALAAFAFGGHYTRGVGKHLKGRAEGFERRMESSGPLEGEKDADGMTRWARRMIIGGPAITFLMMNFARISEWLTPVVQYLRAAAGL